jgi:leader peptidase (prepilin peptidase) / N-methyltransferase
MNYGSATLDGWWLALVVAPFIGSFLGVLIIRLPAGDDIVCSRSRCDWCGHPLGPADLVPILSWLAFKRRCRHCGSPVSWFYPNIEVAALLVAVWAITATDGWIVWVTCVLGWTLLALAVIDSRHLILPDVLTLPLVAAGLGVAAMLHRGLPVEHMIGAVVGYAVFKTIGLTYRLLRGRPGLGHGDAKLLAAAGAWVSWQGLPSVVLIAAGSALLAVLATALVRGTPKASRRLAFGPYLCLGTWLVWLYGPLMIG